MSTDFPSSPVPLWEHDYPGRYAHEIRDLRIAERGGARHTINDNELAKGRLVVELDWPNRESTVRLSVAYPDSYPHLRPAVYFCGSDGQVSHKHISPTTSEICLLGRDTRQWNPSWSVVKLLVEQLDAALNDGDDHEPQGDPVEVWWNGLASTQGASFCLVDSAWRPPHPGPGTLNVLVDLKQGKPSPYLRACVVRATSSDKSFEGSMVPHWVGSGKPITVPWVHLAETLVPDVTSPMQLSELIGNHPSLRHCPKQKLTSYADGRMVALSYPMETAYGIEGVGWLFLYALDNDWLGRKGARFWYAQTLRAGPGDLTVRNAEAKKLSGKTVTVVGAGSLGAPLIIELARNGCSVIHVIESDHVEPGNSVRWPLGVPFWGKHKADALEAFLIQHHPSCTLVVHKHQLGGSVTDLTVMEAACSGTALVFDASASHGVTSWVAAQCRKRALTFVTLMAMADSHGIVGGTVAVIPREGGCPRCLEQAQMQGTVPAFGNEAAEPTLQPPGCSDRTFNGAGYDLEEISLQAVRMAVGALNTPNSSIVATLRFEDVGGVRYPRWQVDAFKADEGCNCRRL